MVRLDSFCYTILLVVSPHIFVNGSLPLSCLKTINQQCRPNECNRMKCYCSPTQQIFGQCIPMMKTDTCFKSTHPSCGGCVSGSSGFGLCKHENFKVPFNYASEKGCETWAAFGGCTNRWFKTYMSTCCIKSCYRPPNKALIKYNEDRCVGIKPQPGSLTRHLFVGKFKDTSSCITRCIEKKFENKVMKRSKEIIGASFGHNGKCWCAYKGATVRIQSPFSYYCRFQMPNVAKKNLS